LFANGSFRYIWYLALGPADVREGDREEVRKEREKRNEKINK
jgi:hypothetical protein